MRVTRALYSPAACCSASGETLPLFQHASEASRGTDRSSRPLKKQVYSAPESLSGLTILTETLQGLSTDVLRALPEAVPASPIFVPFALPAGSMLVMSKLACHCSYTHIMMMMMMSDSKSDGAPSPIFTKRPCKSHSDALMHLSANFQSSHIELYGRDTGTFMLDASESRSSIKARLWLGNHREPPF